MTKTDLMGGRTLPEDLRDLGVAVGQQPTTLNRARTVISGHPGTGKSTLIHGNPKAFILDIEGGGRTVVNPQPVRWPDWETIKTPPTFEDYRRIIRQLIDRKVAGKLQSVETIGIDTFDALLELWKRGACKEHGIENINDYRGGYGKGYDLGCETLFGLLDEVHRAGLGWCVLIHVIDRTVKVGNSDVVMSSLAIPEKFQGYLSRACEHMFFTDHATETVQLTKTVDLGGKKMEVPSGTETRSIRRLLCAPGHTLRGTRADDVKVRVPMIPEFVLPPKGAWGKLEEEYNAAVTRMIEGT